MHLLPTSLNISLYFYFLFHSLFFFFYHLQHIPIIIKATFYKLGGSLDSTNIRKNTKYTNASSQITHRKCHNFRQNHAMSHAILLHSFLLTNRSPPGIGRLSNNRTIKISIQLQPEQCYREIPASSFTFENRRFNS